MDQKCGEVAPLLYNSSIMFIYDSKCECSSFLSEWEGTGSERYFYLNTFPNVEYPVQRDDITFVRKNRDP
jgi:hypothetical protein